LGKWVTYSLVLIIITDHITIHKIDISQHDTRKDKQ
jgi:hypothetical protein